MSKFPLGDDRRAEALDQVAEMSHGVAQDVKAMLKAQGWANPQVRIIDDYRASVYAYTDEGEKVWYRLGDYLS